MIDERGEIAACYKGIPQNDIGTFTDVVDGISKEKGILMLLRSMSPEIIICDEIGKNEDIKAIKKAMCSGVKGIFTAHGSSIDEIRQNSNLNMLIKENIVKKIIILDSKNKGKIKEII